MRYFLALDVFKYLQSRSKSDLLNNTLQVEYENIKILLSGDNKR